MTNEASFKRWYDEDPVVAKCVNSLENLQDSSKRQVATFLMSEIIDKPPFNEMIPDNVFDLVTSETRRRRWYDFDEVVRIFVELLRNATPELKKEIAIKAVMFIEDLDPVS
ncbi:MAG: hypothetical protein PHV68_02150 [Candidatus Gastranaerophilales bacterium]|nr:hypothetical protein [Candidatus Gastranaerophilales bacterium]